jgi:hypothetical protein
MAPVVQGMLEEIDAQQKIVDSAKRAIDDAEPEARASTQVQPETNRRAGRKDYRALQNGGGITNGNSERDILTSLKKDHAAALSLMKKKEDDFEKWKKENKPLSKAEFVKHASDCVNNGFKYFEKLYSEDGEMYSLYKALFGWLS